MSYFKPKMHQIRFSAGALPQNALERLQRCPDPLDGLKGPTSKRRGKGWGGEGQGKGRAPRIFSSVCWQP